MKRLLLFAMMISTMLLFSCSKDTEAPKKVDTTYLYKVGIQEVSDTITYSKIVSLAFTETLGSSNDEINDNDREHCKKHPEDKRCKPLPVLLEYVTVYEQNNNLYVTWKSTEEINLTQYIVERSTDGINFKPIAYIKPKGPSIYTVKDIYRE